MEIAKLLAISGIILDIIAGTLAASPFFNWRKYYEKKIKGFSIEADFKVERREQLPIFLLLVVASILQAVSVIFF
ncbi:MAG: hypothetical protein ABSF44_11585 [Candidatus Bathyarchaeia archaeon]|jgi:hypothetical protein